MNSSAATVTSIIPTMEVCITRSATEWLFQLYDSGAVTFMPDGTASLDKEVRRVIQALHVVLSGGEVKFDIIHDGGAKYERLEDAFMSAWSDSNIANQYASDDSVMPMMP